MERKVVIISFLSNKLTGMLAIDKMLKTLYLQNEVNETNIAFCKENGIQGLNVLYTALNETVINNVHSEGLEVGAWTVDNNSVNSTFKSYFLDYSTVDSLDYEALQTDVVLKTINKLPLYTEKDLRKAESGCFMGGIMGGFIKRQRTADSNYIGSCYLPNTIIRVISTLIIPLKVGTEISYHCDANSKFSVQAFNRAGQALADVGWIAEGSSNGTYTEAREGAVFGIGIFSRNDNGPINEADLNRFATIIQTVDNS